MSIRDLLCKDERPSNSPQSSDAIESSVLKLMVDMRRDIAGLKKEMARQLEGLCKEITEFKSEMRRKISSVRREDISPQKDRARANKIRKSSRAHIDALSCTFTPCIPPCCIKQTWASALEIGPGPSTQSKWGCPLSLFVIQELHHPASCVLDFFPTENYVKSFIFIALLGDLAPDLLCDVHNEHIDSFFLENRAEIVREVLAALRTARANRKMLLLQNYSTENHGNTEEIEKLFSDANAIDAGAYRSSPDSPVDGERFSAAVITAFKLTGAPAKVSLTQLSFSCVCLIMAYANKVKPALHGKVSSIFDGKVPHDDQREMVRVMSASLRRRFSESSKVHSVGWTTPKFHVIDGDLDDDTARFFISEDDFKLGNSYI